MRRWAGILAVSGCLAAGLVAVAPGSPAANAESVCQTTAYVPSGGENFVSTIDVPTRTRNPADIPLVTSAFASGVAITPDGSTA
jgi:hypothetical protein